MEVVYVGISLIVIHYYFTLSFSNVMYIRTKYADIFPKLLNIHYAGVQMYFLSSSLTFEFVLVFMKKERKCRGVIAKSQVDTEKCTRGHTINRD